MMTPELKQLCEEYVREVDMVALANKMAAKGLASLLLQDLDTLHQRIKKELADART